MTWDGGMRVPELFWWPGTIAPDVVTKEIGSTSDLFTTFLGLAGGAIPDDRPMDSLDLAPVLRGDGEGPREEVPFYRGSELYAYRVGNYKAHFITEGEYGLAGERREQARRRFRTWRSIRASNGTSRPTGRTFLRTSFHAPCSTGQASPAPRRSSTCAPMTPELRDRCRPGFFLRLLSSASDRQPVSSAVRRAAARAGLRVQLP